MKLLLRSPFALLALAAVACAPPAGTLSAPMAPPARTLSATAARVVALVDSIGRAAAERPEVPGLSIAVARGSDVLLARGYGFADVDQRVPATAETVYRIGSVTKQFTAAAIMQLVEQGKVRLNDPITRYLPEFPMQGHTVTVRHLLQHTSGVKSYTSLGPRWQARMHEDLAPAELVALFQDEPFEFVPGERWSYSNSGYFLLGLIVERASGQSYADYVREHLFQPLGLTQTRYCPNAAGGDMAEGYMRGIAGPVRALDISMTHPYAAGALCSTVTDLLTWTRALAGGRVVSPASYREMATAGLLDSGKSTDYGYGLAVGDLEGHAKLAHGGGIPGFSAYLAHYPADDMAVAVLVNAEGVDPGTVESAVARAALGLPQLMRTDLPLTAEKRARYPGNYELGPLQLRVFEEKGRLMAQATGQSAFPLLYQGEQTFLLDVPQEIRLVFSATGIPADGLVLHQGGATVPAKRIP